MNWRRELLLLLFDPILWMVLIAAAIVSFTSNLEPWRTD